MDIKEVIEALEKLYNRYWSITNILASSKNYSKEAKKYFIYCTEISYVIKRLKEIFKEEL